MRVALYARVSTEEQATHGLSIEAQLAALDEWAKDKTVVDHYIDPGISARKPASKRPELQRLLRDVEAGKIDLVAFTKLDRWTRAVKEYHKVQEILDAHKVAWRAIHEDYETETASGRFKVNIMLAIAEDEADRTGERVKAVFDDKRRKGLVVCGHVPVGIDYAEGHIKPNADAPKVAELFKVYTATRSINKTILASRELLGRAYSPPGIKSLLQNEKYLQTGIVSPETFHTVQDILAVRGTRTVRTDRVYLFSGLLFCPSCGRRLSARCHVRRGRDYIYYNCDAHIRGDRCTWSAAVREDDCEAFLLRRIMPEVEGHNVRLRKKQAKPVDVAALKRKLDRLTDLYMEEAIDKASFDKRAAPLRDAIRDAQAAPKPVETDKLLAAVDVYPALSRAAKKAFWSDLIRRIIPTDDGFSFDFV